MQSFLRRALCALTAAAVLTPSLLSCGDNSQGHNDATGAETSADSTTVPDSDINTAEPEPDINGEISARCLERAFLLGENLIDKYLDSRKYAQTPIEVKLAERCNVESGRRLGVASVWHYTSAMALVNALARVGDSKEYADMYGNFVDNLEWYDGAGMVTTYVDTSEKSMYAVNRASQTGRANISGVLAVYDDQMWIVRDLVKAYDRTGESEYLDEAVRLARLCIDGWDYTQKKSGGDYGGIPWGPGYSSKHTCSNAPLIAPLVRIYEILNEAGSDDAQYYLEWAEKIYTFSLRFEKDNTTFGDLIGSDRKLVDSDGVKKYVTTSQSSILDQAAYTYNTGAMISGGAALYRATGTEKYKTNAEMWARSAFRSFTETDKSGNKAYISTSTIWFNLILLEGFLDLAPFTEICDKYIELYLTSLDFAYDNYLKDGFLPRNWLTGWNGDSEDDINTSIMDQAASAEIYALLAEYYGK